MNNLEFVKRPCDDVVVSVSFIDFDPKVVTILCCKLRVLEPAEVDGDWKALLDAAPAEAAAASGRGIGTAIDDESRRPQRFNQRYQSSTCRDFDIVKLKMNTKQVLQDRRYIKIQKKTGNE